MNLTKAKIQDFNSIYSEIEKNFIPDERRDYKDALKLLENGDFSVYNVEENGEKIGFITLWHFSDFEFAEHFVIYESFRNKGYGSRALSALKAKFERIVLEAEPPTGEIQKRRLAFYGRNGFFENEKEYMQPAYRKEGEEVPLVIMSYPSPLEDFDGAVRCIKRKVYFSE